MSQAALSLGQRMLMLIMLKVISPDLCCYQTPHLHLWPLSIIFTLPHWAFPHHFAMGS